MDSKQYSLYSIASYSDSFHGLWEEMETNRFPKLSIPIRHTWIPQHHPLSKLPSNSALPQYIIAGSAANELNGLPTSGFTHSSCLSPSSHTFPKQHQEHCLLCC